MKRHLLQVLLPAVVALGVVVLPAATAGAQGDSQGEEPRRGRPTPSATASATTTTTPSPAATPTGCWDLSSSNQSDGTLPRVVRAAAFDATAADLVAYEYFLRAGNAEANVRLSAASCPEAVYELRLFRTASADENALLQSVSVKGDGSSGTDSPLVLTSLVSNLPLKADDESQACVYLQLRVLDGNGLAVDIAPNTGAVEVCNGSGAEGGTDGGGAQGFGG